MNRGKSNKNSYFAIIIFLFSILILGLAFNNPIHIVNGLNEAPETGFEAQISILRILFEPIFGPLLFYLRADQPLKEFVILMIWLMIGMFVYAIVSSLISGAPNKRLRTLVRNLLQWVLKLPIVFIIWVALLIVIIFFPLPSNTIKNNNTDMILVNFHSHTEYSHDGIISLSGLLQWHQRNGFDAFFISEHNHHTNTLKAVQAQRKGNLASNPFILCGQEYSGSNHLLLLGLHRDFNTSNKPDEVVIDSTHANHGVAFVAHWFADEHRTIQYYIDCGVDGFEIANQAEGISYDHHVFTDIVKNCISNDLLMIGACDYHGYGSACFVWNALHIPDWHQMNDDQKEASILNILRHHDQDKLAVLLYRDRMIFARSMVFLSPVFTFSSYFRSLNFYQILSWIFWMILIFLTIHYLNNTIKINIPSQRIWGIVGFICGLFTIITGIHLLIRAQPLSDYNNILSKYGNMFLWYGLGFTVYSAVLIVFNKKLGVYHKK